MAGKAPREKGARLERLIVDILTSYGLEAKRVPLSGAAIGFKGDVHTTINAQQLQLEAKSRRKGFGFIYDSLGDNDGLVIKTDRADPLIIMPLRRLARLLCEGKSQQSRLFQSSDNPPTTPQFNPKGRVSLSPKHVGDGYDLVDILPSSGKRASD